MISRSAHLSMLFAGVSDRERPALAHAAGFRTVESWWPEDGAEIDAWAAELARLDLDVALLNCPCGDIRAGARGYLNQAGAEAHALEDFERAVELAARVGASNLNLLCGIAVEGQPVEAQLDRVAELVGACAELAARRSIKVLIEPLNEHDVPGYLICTVPAALALAERSGSDHVGLLYDAYHAARGGRDVEREIAEFGDRIDHVQYADHPGRGAPGSGTLDLERISSTLGECGYRGVIGLEYEPADGPAEMAMAVVDREAKRGHIG